MSACLSAFSAAVLKLFGTLYALESELQDLDADERRRIRQIRSRPLAEALHQWMLLHRLKVPEGSAIAKAIDYRLTRWAALTRFLDKEHLPFENNWVENRIRPIALRRSNWSFAGSLRAGQRAAAVKSLTQSTRLNGHVSVSLPQGRAQAAAKGASESHRETAAALRGVVIKGSLRRAATQRFSGAPR